MQNTFRNRTAPVRRFRSRAAMAAAGLCAGSVLLGGVATAGAAAAAEGAGTGTSGASAVFDTSHTAGQLAESTRGQAHHQEQAAEAAKAAKRKAEARKRRAEAAQRKLARSWVTPVSGDYSLTASFSQSGSMWSADHSGQDFAVASGTTVRAVHGGTVVKAGGYGAGDGPAYGNAVVIEHSSGVYTQYAHLSGIDVSVGEAVTTGEAIARSGNSGNSTGPHLHFEVRTTPDYGTAVDPMKFLRSKDVTL